MKKILLAAGLIALASGTAHAATAAGTAKAVVVSPLNITHTPGALLDFGTFTSITGGQISISASASPTVGTNGDVAFVSGNTNSADAFAVAGEGNRAFAVNYGSAINLTNGSATMSFTPTGVTTAALSSGAYTLYVGGTLTVGPNQASGTYNGTYNVTVNYQ